MFLDVQRQESPSGSAESIKTGVNERSHLTEIYFCPLGHCRRPLLAIATLTAVCGEYTGGIFQHCYGFHFKTVAILPCVTALRFWMPDQIKNRDRSLSCSLPFKNFMDGDRSYVSRIASVRLFDRFLQ